MGVVASFPLAPPVLIATVGAVVYALPVVLNAILDAKIAPPLILIVAAAPTLTGAEIVTVGGEAGSLNFPQEFIPILTTVPPVRA